MPHDRAEAVFDSRQESSNPASVGVDHQVQLTGATPAF
jgi:hypothetical protein